MNFSIRSMTFLGISIFISLVFSCKSAEAQNPCWENTTTDCAQGTNILCSTCRKWYLNPATNQWQLAGLPGWKTDLRCLNPGAQIYSNTTDIPIVRQLAANEGPGKDDIRELGDVVCITFIECNCVGANMVIGSPCNASPDPIENKIKSEETQGDGCHLGIE